MNSDSSDSSGLPNDRKTARLLRKASRYRPETMYDAISYFCEDNGVACGICRKYYPGIGGYCTGMNMSPVISGDEPELKVKAIKELEKRQYLPPGEMELMKMVPGARALSIIRSRRLRKMNSKVYLAAIKELAEFIQITNIDPGREDI